MAETNEAPVRPPTDVAESPVPPTGEVIRKQMFSFAGQENTSTGIILYETDVNASFVHNLKIFIDKDQDKTKDENEKFSLKEYKVYIFVSRDDSYLKQAYHIIQPAPEEVCIFLEDNASDIFSGAKAYIAVGEKFRKQMETLDFIGENTLDSYLSTGDINTGFTREQLEQLILKGKIPDGGFSLFGMVQKVLIGFNSILSGVFNFAGDTVFTFTAFLREYIKFQEEHWDPEAPVEVTENGEKKWVPNPGFEPQLFPYSYSLIEPEQTMEDWGINKMIDEMVKGLKLREKDLLQKMPGYITAVAGHKDIMAGNAGFFMSPFRLLFEVVEKKVGEFIPALTALCKQMADDLKRLFRYTGKKLLNAVNAYFCGMWNSFIEAIIGWVDLAGLLLKGMAAPSDVFLFIQNDVPELLDEAWQSFISLVQAVQKIDVVQLITDFFQRLFTIDIEALAGSAVMKTVSGVSSAVNSISVERIAYFIGALVGFLIEMVVEALATGGTAELVRGAQTLGQLMVKFGEVGAGFLKFCKAELEVFMKLGLSEWPRQLFLVLKKIIKFLAMGTEKIKMAMGELFEYFAKLGNAGAELLEETLKKLKFMKSEQKVLQKCGYEFVEYAEGMLVLVKKCT